VSQRGDMDTSPAHRTHLNDGDRNVQRVRITKLQVIHSFNKDTTKDICDNGFPQNNCHFE